MTNIVLLECMLSHSCLVHFHLHVVLFYLNVVHFLIQLHATHYQRNFFRNILKDFLTPQRKEIHMKKRNGHKIIVRLESQWKVLNLMFFLCQTSKILLTVLDTKFGDEALEKYAWK